MRKLQPKLTDIRIDDLVAQLGRQPRILIVDDEEDMREVLESAFSIIGYSVTTEGCTNTAGARILTRGEMYDIVFSDVNNKHASGDGQGGITLHRRLEEAAALPVVYAMMSGETGWPIPADVPFASKSLGLYGLAHRVTTEFRGKLTTVVSYTSQTPEAK